MPSSAIDQLVYQVHFGTPEEQVAAFTQIRLQAEAQGAVPSSIHPIYKARGEGALEPNFTVPAFNLRGMSYLTAQAAFEAALETQTGLVLFELARSEMRYTFQTPLQLAASVLGAVVKTGWKHPVFIQGDHYQPKPSQPGLIKDGEKAAIIQLIKDSLEVGMFNLDIDGSTLVHPDQPTEYDQQRPNFAFTAEMIHLIHDLYDQNFANLKFRLKPEHQINVGCEISEVGTHLSKSSQLSAFMTGLRDEGFIHEEHYPTKVAIETGTAHGGKVNRDGSAAPMKVDFERLKTISIIARHKYGMAGAVQHGASTLDKDIMQKFPEYEAAEIHLSTGFQNTILGHTAFPQSVLEAMYTWCDVNCREEKNPEWSQAQFYVKTRKKAWGPFKKQTWEIHESNQLKIKEALKQECAEYYQSFGVTNSFSVLQQYYS